jgi:LmbE family N-acetylglucosaminyl deacetylase
MAGRRKGKAYQEVRERVVHITRIYLGGMAMKIGRLFCGVVLAASLLVTGKPVAANTSGALTDAFYIVPHPDDELLSMGASIINHNFYGNNRVHLVLLTGGEHSGVYDVAAGHVNCWYHGYKHDPVAEGYAPFDREKFRKGKIENFKHVAYMLGVKPENIHIYDLGNEDVQVSEVENIIRDLDAKYPNNKWKSMSYHDNHEDHSVSGVALQNMLNQGVVSDVRFYAKNSMVHGGTWPSTTKIFAERYNPDWRVYIDAGIRAYKDWNPVKGYFHAGWVSVPKDFQYLEADPTDYYHLPGQ